MRLGIIGMGIMGCNYARMIADGLVRNVELAAVTRITPERKEKLKDVFAKEVFIYESAEELFAAVRKKEIILDAVHGKSELFVQGSEGSKSLMLANAMYLSSWKRQMVKIPENAEEELAFEETFEEMMRKKLYVLK